MPRKRKREQLRNNFIEIEIGNEVQRIQNQRKRIPTRVKLRKQDIQEYLGITKHQMIYGYETEERNKILMENLKEITIQDMMKFMSKGLIDELDTNRTKYTNNTNKKHDKSK